uniref:Uncharacterized protein n=1 Tax=Glossina austeni TaxID=7395 RepID=A0A1A9UZK8_GLOAU
MSWSEDAVVVSDVADVVDELRCCDDDTVDDDEDAPPSRPPRRGLCKPTPEVPVLEEAIAATAAALVIFGGAITGGSFLRLPDAPHPFYGYYAYHVLFSVVRGKDLRHINHYAHALAIAHCSCREPFHWRELAVVVDKIQCCLHHREILNHLDDDPSFPQTWVTSYQYPWK